MRLDPNTIRQVKTKLETQYNLKKGYAQCPAHGGKDNNLRVTFLDNGIVLTHCHSHRCEHEKVMSALGIKNMPKQIDNRQEVYSIENYPYMTVDGQEVWAVRHNFEDGSKSFKTLPAGVKGKLLPYRHDTLKAAKQIIIVEGEKAVEWLLTLGYTATTNKSGAGNTASTDWSLLAGHKDIILWADDDDPGKEWEQELTQILHDLNCTLNRVPVEFSSTKMDAANFTKDQVKDKLASIKPIASPYKMYSHVELMGLEGAKYDWLVEGAIINTGFFLIAAKPKSGKSTISRQLALCVANGVPFLGKDTKRTKTCYMGFEDGVTWVNTHINEHILNPIHNTDPKLTGNNIGFYVDMPPVIDFNQRLTWLYSFIKHNDLGFVMIDSLFFFLEGIQDSNSYDELIQVLKQLKDLAKKTSCAIGCTHHTKKAEGDYTLDNCLGSTGIAGTFEAIFLLRNTKDGANIESKQRGGDGINGRLTLNKERWMFKEDSEYFEKKEGESYQKVVEFFKDFYHNDRGRNYHDIRASIPYKIGSIITRDGLDSDLLLTWEQVKDIIGGRKQDTHKALNKYIESEECLVKVIGDGMAGSPRCFVPDNSKHQHPL